MIDAFRLTDPRMQALGQEPRQTTSNLGHLEKPSIQVRVHVCESFLLGREYSLTWTIRNHTCTSELTHSFEKLSMLTIHVQLLSSL